MKIFHPINDLIVWLILGGPKAAVMPYKNSPDDFTKVYECVVDPGPCVISKVTLFSSSSTVTLGQVKVNAGPSQLVFIPKS